MQQDASVRRPRERRLPGDATAIPARFVRERRRVLRILARWQASIEARQLRVAGAR